jgi:hypothetical protein
MLGRYTPLPPKTNMNNPSARRRSATIAAVAIVAILTGCDRAERTETHELVNAGNGLVYRINKTSGEVSLIAGAQITKLDEWRAGKKDEPKKSYMIDWPERTLSHLGDIKLELKTTWREGKMFYIFRVSPYAGRVETERDKATSYARFNVNFYDSDGFEILTLPIKLSEMTRKVDDKGKPASLSMNANTTLTVETYEAIKAWAVGWAGFE